MDYDKYTELLQWHAGVELFDYNPVIDWAIHMIQTGIEPENMLILASFSKPVVREEIKPYVSGVLKELNLEEKVGEYSIVSNCYFHVQQIVDEYNVRKNLASLHRIHLDNNYSEYTKPFFLLYHSWEDLEAVGFNYYYCGATLDNIEAILRIESQKFIAMYIDKSESKTIELQARLGELCKQEVIKQPSILSRLLTIIQKKNPK